MSKIGEEIILSNIEQRLAVAIGKQRYESSRKSGVHNAKMGGQGNDETDREGAAAEIAFCKLFNCYPDLSIEIKSAENGTDKGDAIIGGKAIDVKSTKYATGRLLATMKKKNNESVYAYALLTGTMPNYIFRGFMKREELLSDDMIGDLGHGRGYMAEQNKLLEWEDLEKSNDHEGLEQDSLIGQNELLSYQGNQRNQQQINP